jgi:DNA-binding winged helix-turn-helix (wHTH) protein
VRLTFGDCVADFDTHEILLVGRPVHVEPRALRLLELLVAARPRALSKEELHEALWPGTYVTERSLARLAWDLRKALRDDPDQSRYIRTVPRFGYAFCAPVHPLPRADRPEARFGLLWAGRRIALYEGENVLGREHDAAAWIHVGSVSRRHARITVSGERATLEDLGSKNGTFLEGEPVTGPTDLADGDHVRMGSVEMVVRRLEPPVSTQSMQPP